MLIEQVLIISSLLLFISVALSKVSTKLGIPVLLFFLLIGILASENQIGIIPFKDITIAKNFGIISLILILFLGGIETDFNHIRPILKSGILLSTLGAILTTFIVGVSMKWITRGYLSFEECLLLGAIVASTDAVAVFSILGACNIQLKAYIGSLLELESSSNDMMVFFIMGFLFKRIKDPSTGFYTAIPHFFQEMFIGAFGGLVIGYIMVFVINKIKLSYPGLYPALVISMVFFGYAIVNSLHGSGFLAVYIAGMWLGEKDFIHKKSLIGFYKGISWLMQITMFITLGLLVDPNILIKVAPWGIQLSLLLMLVARPISTFISLAFSPFTFKQKTFVAWIGLRGAAPIIFATYLYTLENREHADTMFHLVCFIVLVSISLQGSTLYPLANWLKLEDTASRKQKKKQVLEASDEIKKMLIELEVPINSPAKDIPIVELGFPKNALIAFIYREKRYMLARGSTIIKIHDKLLIMMDAKKDLKDIKACLGIR